MTYHHVQANIWGCKMITKREILETFCRALDEEAQLNHIYDESLKTRYSPQNSAKHSLSIDQTQYCSHFLNTICKYQPQGSIRQSGSLGGGGGCSFAEDGFGR